MYKRFSWPVMFMTLSGTIPFFGILYVIINPMSVRSLVPPEMVGTGIIEIFAHLAMLGYGAVILSFMTGIRWGQGFTTPGEDVNSTTMLLAGVPAIISWIALMVGYIPGNWAAGCMFIVSGCYLLLLAWDSMANYPAWYFTVRIIATLSSVGCLCYAAISAMT